MEFESKLFNPFQNRLEIPLYHIPWITFLGKFMGIVSIFANYYVNIDNIYYENEQFVRTNQMDKLQSLQFDTSKYVDVIKEKFKSIIITQLPDAVVDIIITYVIGTELTDEGKKQISFMLFRYEWYKAHGISNTSKRIWYFVHRFNYIWSLCRAFLWTASFIILMYEYHFMRPEHSSWENYILFLWILGYFHPFLHHEYAIIELAFNIVDDDDSEDNEPQLVILEDGTLNSREFESVKMIPKVWQISNMIGLFCLGLWDVTAIFPMVIPGVVIYSPFLLGFFGLIYSIQWLLEKLEKLTEGNYICLMFYRVLSAMTIAIFIPAFYWSYIWFNMVSTASLFCFYKNGKWWDCLVDSFNIQDSLILPQSNDWRMIIVLLAMMF